MSFRYTVKHLYDDQYECMMNIDIEQGQDQVMNYFEDLVSYLKRAGYLYISISPFRYFTIVEFTLQFKIQDANDILYLIDDIYLDFEYVNGILSNEKKILRHYPSILASQT